MRGALVASLLPEREAGQAKPGSELLTTPLFFFSNSSSSSSSASSSSASSASSASSSLILLPSLPVFFCSLSLSLSRSLSHPSRTDTQEHKKPPFDRLNHSLSATPPGTPLPLWRRRLTAIPIRFFATRLATAMRGARSELKKRTGTSRYLKGYPEYSPTGAIKVGHRGWMIKCSVGGGGVVCCINPNP